MSDVETQLVAIANLLAPVQDIIADRVASSQPPPWLHQRGWSCFLLALSDNEVMVAERDGLPAVDLRAAPNTLRSLCEEANAFTERFRTGALPANTWEREHVKRRKRIQVAAIIDRLRGHESNIQRIVDMGAGHGHLARAAHRALGLDVIGVDRDGDRVHVARSLASQSIAFVEGNANAVALSPTDLVVGLHACGALGDALIHEVAAARADVVLISCCMQKIDGAAWHASSQRGRELALSWPRRLLGLSNLSWGVDAAVSMHGREVRHALRSLLASRGVIESEGDVAQGINKRRFRKGLAAVASMALARRGLPPPTELEIIEHSHVGAREYGHMRRLSLPRNLLGRLMELTIVLDRARFLEEQGYRVAVEPAFDTDVSPRNLGLFAVA